MEILSFLDSMATPALAVCIGVTCFLIYFSPMSRILRAGVFLSVAPFYWMVFFRLQQLARSRLLELANYYSWAKAKADFFSYHASFFLDATSFFTHPEVYPALISLAAVALTTWFLVTVTTRRYFADQKLLGSLASLITGMMAIIGSYGILLPIVPLGLFLTQVRAKSSQRVIEGREALKDMYQGLLKSKIQLIFKFKNGIFIHPLLRIPRSLEETGIIIFGTAGSGKTHLIKTFFVPQIRKRGDMSIIYDYKGDFTKAMGEDDDVLILSPLDDRSAVWDIAKDIDTEAMAWEFARMVVQKGDSPTDTVFEDWSRDLLTACLIKLQREKKNEWNFKDFYEQSQDLDLLIEAVGKYRKQAEFAANFEGESKQFEGIKGTIRQSMVRLEPLARAWGHIIEPSRSFSIKGWLKSNGGLKPTLLIRYDPQYDETMGPFVSNFLNFLMVSVLSLPEAEGAYKNRCIWAVLDELQTIPRIPILFKAARAGRSKGMRMLLGTQDMGKTDHVYKSEGGKDALINLIGIKLIGRLGSEGMRSLAAGMMSKNKVLIQNKNVQKSQGKTTTSYSESTRFEPAISPGEFGSVPKPTSYNGSVFWLVHESWNPVRLGYVTKSTFSKYDSLVEAPWLTDKDREKPAVLAQDQKPVRKNVQGDRPAKKKIQISLTDHKANFNEQIKEVYKSATGENIENQIPQPEGA